MLNEKAALRSRLLAERAALSPEQRYQAAVALGRRALELLPGTEPAKPSDRVSVGAPERAPVTVAGYVSVGAEPGTRTLLDALHARGVRVLLPVLLPDNDLDWGRYEGADGLVRARKGLWEPGGEPLGPAAVCSARLVLLPGLAVDRRGMRLGRGGGSYDRVLARLAAAGSTARLVTLLYDGEVLADPLPVEPHDRPVDAAVTPSQLFAFDEAR
jgi:5-formyltetrahydrofolate cyclo-ligase